jgi:hypothetical protein
VVPAQLFITSKDRKLLEYLQLRREVRLKTIKSVNVGSFVLYGAVLSAFWTLIIGWFYWILGWLFGATSAWIDMNLANWSIYSATSFIAVVGRAIIAAVGGALAGLVLALVYNFVAGLTGGLKINVE